MIFHSNIEKGRFGEKTALKYLKKKGYKKVAKNYRTKHSEIDLIVKNKTHLVFVEVKTRDINSDFEKFGRPARAVNEIKRRHILNAVSQYLRDYENILLVRVDIVEVYLDRDNPKNSRIEHIENAFGAK